MWRVCDALLKSTPFFSCEIETGTFSPIEEKVSRCQKETCSTEEKSKGMLSLLGEIKKDTHTHLAPEKIHVLSYT